MNKSELKKRILESLTPDEASKVDVKYKEIYAGMVGKNPLKMKKYDNPDKVAYGRAINLIKKESAKLSEKLGKDADLGDHIEDFQKSDAPQFQGKSQKKINQMAQAAFLNKEEQKLDEEIENSTFERHADRVEDLLRQLIKATQSVDSSQDDTEDDVEELDKSIDYLAAAITDKDPIDIAVDQSTFGRLAKPTKEEKTLEKIDAIMEKEDKLPVNDIKKAIKALLKKEGGAAGLSPILKLSKDFDNVTQIDIEDILDNDMKDVEKHRDGDYILKEDAKDKSEKNYSNYFKKMDKNRLEEFVKEALKNPKKADLNKDGELSDYEKARATAIEKSIDKVDESFDSLVKKVDKSKGYTKGEAEKVAGAIAAKKMKGAGKGPTAKQKKRMAETILKELRGGNVKLSPQEQEIFNDITSSLNEGMFDDVLEKVKRYARKGLMTVALLSALAAPNLGFSQAQQQQLKDVAQTEMSTNEISRMKKIGIVTTALSKYKRGKDLDKLDDYLKQDLDGVKGGIQNADQLINIFDFHQDALQAYVPLAF
tara:strand:+ start:98 stop:1711 length:1614 start_codon:yes stop_codon:yes gene_type:complete